jgi:hypothetical protein
VVGDVGKLESAGETYAPLYCHTEEGRGKLWMGLDDFVLHRHAGARRAVLDLEGDEALVVAQEVNEHAAHLGMVGPSCRRRQS